MSNEKNDWRSRVKAMMTDPNYAEKMASVVDDTRKVNTGLMNKSEELESSLSLDKPTSQPLDLARVGEMKAEDAARATMPSEDDSYSGVSDLATKLYAEERKKRIGKALQRSNTYYGAPHGMRLSQAASDIYDVEKAKDVQGIYDKVLQDESVSQAIRINADKALSKAMEANQSMSEDEQKKVYDDAVNKQLEAIGKGIDKYLYDINAPKSEAEWVAKNAVNSSIMGQMLTSPMNVEGGENAYRQQALADYGAKASWLSQGISMAGSLIIDTLPMMGIGTAFAAPASKAAMWGVGKVGGKALQGSLIGRGVVGSVGGAATLGGYNAASTLTTQFSNGQFDLGEITSSAGHGALMGGLTGVMSPVLRGVSQGMGKVGKAATMAGGLGAEASIFSAAELAEMENPYDFETIAQTFGKNVVVIGGLKLSNPIKTIGEYKRWYNEGKQSNFDDADYKMMADFAKANGFANNEAFAMSADGVYSRSIADRVTGNRTLLELTKLEGGKERNLAIEMYNDPNVPISLKTKIAAKMNLPAPKPLLANGVRVEGNKAITYCTMPNGAQQVIEIKEFKRPRNARAFANEFSRTTARKNDLMQTEAAVNNISTEPIVIARLNEQAERNGTTYDEELARLNAITQKAIDGTITAEDVAYYSSIVDTDISATEAIKQGIKDEYGVEIDDVLKSDGNLTDVQDKALTAYADALRGIVEQGNPTTERMLVASTSGVADYVALNRLGIEQTRQIMTNPTQRAEIDAQMRSKYGAWLKYFDGKMGEDALAAKLGYDLNNSTDLQDFLAEQTYFKNKAADRIAANTVNAAKAMLELGGRSVRFTENGKVKLQGVPYPVEVSQEIVDRYNAAMQGSGESMYRIVNDALKDIIKQSETPSVKEPMTEEAPDVTEQPMTDADAVTQQMVDARIAEIDTDLQGIEADGVQRMTINGRPVAIIKGRIVADADGKVDKTKSSTEVAYMLLDENGRPILEDGKPKIEVGVKPSNVRVEDIEQWRSVDDYKASEEQRIRENNRLTDEAMQMADEEIRTEEMPAESKAEEIADPQTTDELLTLCKGDRELALDVAMDELNRAQQSKGKGANAAETMAINQRIRTYQRMVDELSKVEEPTPTEAPTEQTTDSQVTDDMEFIYQQGLDENHEGMEPMQIADGRYKWAGLQRGELTATMGERDAELLDGLAKKLGVAIIPIDVADSAVNGYYRDGNIYVNTNRGAEWTMRWVAGHEMLHDVAKKSPEAYNAYKQAVLNMWDSSYIDSQVKQIIDDYAASGKTIDREQALTELVNDFGGELFNSRDGLNILDNILKSESRKGNTGFVNTIKQWWERLKEWFGGTPYYKNVEKLLKDAYSEAIANAEEFRRNQEMDKGVSSVTDAARVEGAAIDFSIKTEPQVAQRLREYAESEDGKKHGWDKEKIESIIDETEDLIDAIHNSLQGNQRYDAWADKNPTMRVDWRDGELKQTVTWSRGNIEYKYDMSADLLCINNEALEDVLASPAMVQIVRGMDTLSKNGFTSDDYLRIYQVLRDKGFVVPCAGCFDAAARFKMLPSVAKNFADLVNKTIDERNADPEAFDAKVKAMAKGETTIEGLPTSANTKQDAIMIGVAGDKLTEHITSEQLLSAQGQTDMLATLGGIFRAWQRTGAGRPKDKLLPEPYVGDINSTSTTILGKYGEKTPSYRDIYVNQGTGLRRNSHSEFRPLLAIDEIQFMRDAFAKGLTVFKYMKELDDVRLFGNMGVKFNMSFFPAFVKDGVAAGLDANGNYIASEESVGSREFAYMGEDGRTHFDGTKGWQEAQKYTNENVSLSSVVFSVPHLIKSLTDVPTPSDKSGMWGSLIPFHSTGATSAHLALQGLGRARANGIGHPFSEAMHDYNKGVTNFEDVQNDRFGEGWVIVEGKKAGTAIKGGHKLEFVNGTHMYNERLGVHLFKDGYIFDKDIKKKDNYGNGKVNTKNVKKYMTKFYVDYNDKVRELGGDYAYKDAADYYLRELPKIGLIPRFSFEVPESIYLEMCKAANVDPKHPKLGWKGEGNAWNPIDAESYYSLFCDYGMTDPKTGKWSPHKPIGNVDENGNRVFRLPDNAVQIVKDAVDKYSARRDKEESRINDVYEEFLKRSVKDGRLSEAEAQNLLSEISADADYSISRKIDEKYPNWLEGTTTSSGKHSTQVAGTIGTYRKVGKWIKENLGNDIRILDASSGMGLGTEALRKDGMQIDDVEPYQSEERKKTNPATFSSYKDINGKYDFIISNAVLNVIPDDWRSNVLHDMVARLNNGGRLFINTRKAGEEKTIKDKIELDSPQEILVKRNGKIASYQRFFTPNELKEWVENELGEGYSVEVANEKNSGTKGLAAVVVRKLSEQPTDPNGGGKPTEEFSIKADKELEKKSLVGVHNLTEDNLRYALNLGGLANPSTAVIDKNIMSLEGFGDISLIMPKSLVAKSTGKNAGTFAGDAYTPRFPKGDVVKYITKEGEKAIRADYPGDDKFSKDFREAWQSYGNEYGGITPALYYMYKLENGGAKIVKAEAPKIKSKEHQRMIDKFGNKEWYELNDAEKRELVDYRKSEMIESLKGADKNMVDKVVNDFINSADPEDLAYKKLRMLKMNYKEQQKAGEIDYMATYRNAQDDVALAGEQAKFNKWLADKSKRYGIEDRIFRGYTSSGNRKYAPMTLANISKVMKEQGRAGAETFMTKSAYSLRGKMLPVYKTLEQIKKNKSKLADTETYEKFRNEIGDEYNELILDISELPNVKYDDTHYILEDALLKGFDYAEKQAGVQISDAVRERISAFGNLLKEAPVKYFETKFERPVMFDEFVAAVVPKNINPELRKALADKGLAIEEYERGSEESRLEAVRRASDRDDVQFSVKGKRADESVLDYAKRMSEETGKKNLLNGGSYFSGGGLLEEGLKGIVNPTIAVEFNQKVAGVYRNNFGEHIVTADVRDVDPAELIKDIDGPVAYFHASPVCKNFSRAKRNAEELPLDKETAQSTAKFISEVRPKIVTIENVKGYRNSEAMKIILDELEKQGYNYDADTYNAADYGAYTSRERLIVRAVRDWPLPPKPIKMLADERPSGWLEAVADLIDGLPQTKNGVPDWMDVRLKAMGIDYRTIDKPLYVFGSGYSKDRIGCAFSDELVPALRTKGGDIIVMPDGRVLKATPRVLARISGMSDDYTMPKTDDLAHTIVGNGIPVQLTKAVMGSLIENVKSDLDSGATEYSIIGKRGASNLDKRDETSIRVDNMVTAEEMEKAGKDAKTIRMATGWERGADGKWRYEVKDLVMLPVEQWIGKRGKTLSNIVENADELFAAYPELAKVKIKEGNGKTYSGSYSSGVITLDTYLAKLWMKRLPDSLPRANKYMSEALIHEIQHYIQEQEGFARGGNENIILNKDAMSEISALVDDSNELATQYNNMIATGVYEGREAVKDKIIALRAKATAIKNSNRIGVDGYRRLAGEVEARNVEKRLGMTEEERKNSLLADTEDVGRDEQIVYGNTDADYSIKIGGKEYRNDGYTQRGRINLSRRADEAIEARLTDIGMDAGFGRFIADNGLGEYDGEYHHVGQKFNPHYFAKLNNGVTLASARKAYKKYLEDKSNKEVADVLKKHPDAITMDGGIYRDYKEVAYAGGKFWFVPRGENEPRPTIYRELPQGEDVQFSIKGGKNLEDRLESKYTQTRLRAARELAGDDESALMILDDLEPQTLEEYVAEQLGANGRKLLWENGKFSKGLKAHLGVSENEKKTYRSIISKDGYPPEVLAEEIWKSMPEEFYERYTDQDVFNTILDLASSYTRKQLKDFVVNRRIDAVIEFARKQEEWDAAQEEMYLETLSEQERNAYLANKEEMERVDKMSKKERAEYYKQKQVEQMLGEMTPEERAEYEAKEQWRKDNAAAITSSFFAERRLDKADKIQKLKDEINKLIKETRATNKENSEKVQQIAKEMQTFIKENIPTETQGDMTRPQFEQVIKQLAKAITRKDLEEPMRMVEYIGANANRRALTRQMRDFLKQGFKGMTPKGLVKAKNVDGATSRVLGLAKSLYESMGKQPLGSDLRALQTKVRGIKAELEDLNNANGGAFSEYVEQINAILKKSGVDRYEEMTKYYNELTDRQDVGEIQVSEVLDHINRMLPELFSIELVKEQRTQAKADSAMTTKEDLEQLKNDLYDKREKGILSEEDQAVLDNMAMYELMVDLQQRQLDIDGPGTSSIASQMAAKVREAKQYRDELEKYDDKQSGVAKYIKDNIKRVNAEMEELFVQRTQAQKEVNANVAELLDNLKQLRDTGNSTLKEWSKNKQERETRIVNMANASFGKDARGYWSEVDRRGGWKRDFSNKINNLRLAALMSPALSFEYMVGVMDPRFYTNESPIYKQFIKGEDGLIKANDNFFEGLEAYNNGINEAVERFINRNAMQSLKEYFNKGDRFATEIIPFEFEVKENVNGEVVTSIVHRDAEMTRGRAAKIYAWSRMADGMAKLKAHGVTDETLEVVKAFIGQDYIDFIDWVEDVYFPKLRREKYNPIYKKMYGISMAENEHYFPFETYKKDIRTEKELEQINSDNLGGGIVGNIIERKRNNARLDFTDESPDIFDAISEYGRKMEEWAAYAQVREDLKKVINNKQFKQHCDMLGTNYYNHFLDAARVASRLYNPQPSAPQLQNAAAKLQKVFASAAISLRVSTALKQLLSAPAFAVYSLDPAFHKELLKTASVIDVESAIKGLRELANGNKAEAKKLLLEENWIGHYNWCVNNLPSFRERVGKGGAGNPILEEKGWSKFSDDVQSVGMLPNRLVDAFTCSVGAKAIYEYAFNKYKKTYDEATAHNMAVTDAEIAFNSSQQSSNPVFLSPLQSSKEFWLRGIMNYKNSPIGYYRAGMKANIDLYRATKALFGKPKFTINGEQVGFESNGVNPAAKAAEAAAKSIMFNFFLNFIWNFGVFGIAGVSHTMMGNDKKDGNMLYTDEEFDKATGGNMGLAVFNAATQGIPWISGFASVSQTGQDYTPSILFSEMNNYLEQVNKEGFMSLATAQLLIDLGLKNAIGVDPEVWGQIYRGAQGIMADRPMRTEDFMNLLASPRSAIAGVAKQKVGEYDNMQDYVNARIESEREIGINETMDLGKKLTGLRPLRKSKLDGYIDEYLADKIPDYRELANKPDEKAKEERMEESNAFKNLNTLVSTVQHTEEKKKSSKKIDGNEETKDKVKKIRKAVNVIHKLYASGDASSAQRIADELERRLKRGYNENGATLDDKLRNVDIYDSTGTTEQRGNDGFDTMFDRAMLGGFDGVYLGGKLD